MAWEEFSHSLDPERTLPARLLVNKINDIVGPEYVATVASRTSYICRRLIQNTAWVLPS
jgi:hypothetical protein